MVRWSPPWCRKAAFSLPSIPSIHRAIRPIRSQFATGHALRFIRLIGPIRLISTATPAHHFLDPFFFVLFWAKLIWTFPVFPGRFSWMNFIIQPFE
jgi:hypothetical protein